jgi:hypothetical protein
MKYFFLLFCLSLSVLAFSQQKIKVQINYINSYCGGARPTDEIIAKYNTTNKLANFKIKLVGKKIIHVLTDSVGCFSCKLKLGNYFIFLTEEKNKSIFINYNPDCDKMLKTSYAELHIEKNKVNYELILSFPCDPCSQNNKP